MIHTKRDPLDPAAIENVLEPLVAEGQLAGAVALVWRDGRALRSTVGYRDPVSRVPVERDTLFRIASLTKPVTTVAALAMLDEGQFALDDDITGCAPEFGAMRVLREPDGPLDQCESVRRPITFRDLLTHRAGFTYGDFHHGPVGGACADTLGAHIDNPLTPDEWMARLAALPLIGHPGAGFHYGHSTDLLGFLLARLDGAPLSTVLERRVLTPLGMRDTGFTVPRANRERCAALCGFDEQGHLTTLEQAPGGHALAERPQDMTFESGGQGLWSTADDYLIFARMLIGQVPLLRPETLALMTSNQLTPDQRAGARMFGRPIFASGHGYGMGVAVVIEPEHADPLRCRGGAGTIGWPGAYGSWWQADPTDGSVLILLSHNMVGLQQMARGIGLGVWDAIARFHRLAAA